MSNKLFLTPKNFQQGGARIGDYYLKSDILYVISRIGRLKKIGPVRLCSFFFVWEKPVRLGGVNTVVGKYQRKFILLPFCPSQLDNYEQSNDKDIQQ